MALRISLHLKGNMIDLREAPTEDAQAFADLEAIAEAEVTGAVNPIQAKTENSHSGLTPPEISKVGGKLTLFASAWEKNGATYWQLRTVKRGLSWTFLNPPPLSPHPIFFHERNPTKHAILGDCILTLLNKGAIEEVENPLTPGFYSVIFLRAKKNGEMRPIIDLSHMNSLIHTPTFKMESSQTIRANLSKGQWAASIDLEDAYFHIPVRKSFRKYLRFTHNNQVWQFKVLPFGLSVAPLIFTGIMALVGSVCHQNGIKLHLYLDDWLIRADSREVVSQHVQFLTNLMSELGLNLNLKKSQLEPTQNFVFLGYLYDLTKGTVRPTTENVTKLVVKTKTLLYKKQGTAVEWLSMIGSANAVAPLTPFGRITVCPLEIHVQQYWHWTPNNPNIMKTIIPVTSAVREILHVWTQPHLWDLTVSLAPFKAQLHLFTDASTYGWGAHMDHHTASGVWNDQEKLNHINVLECEAVRRALLQFQTVVQNRAVLVSTDNSTTMSYINRQGGTRSIQMYETTKNLLMWCHTQNILLKAVHIKGSMNVMADLLSRDKHTVNTEWSLLPLVTQNLWKLWFLPDIDLFATIYNRKLVRYVSPFPDNNAVSVDALSMTWDHLRVYAFPPFAILKKVIQKLEQSVECEMIMITPYWPNQPWFATLLNLSQRPPIQLPQRYDLLKQPVQALFHQSLETLNLHAWNLFSGN